MRVWLSNMFAALTISTASALPPQAYQDWTSANTPSRISMEGEYLFTDGGKDFSGNGRSGGVSGTASVANGVLTTGATGWVQAASFNATTSLSVFAWIKTTNIISRGIVTKYDYTANKRSWELVLANTTWNANGASLGWITSADVGTGVRVVYATNIVADGTWHHVGAIYSPSGDQLFVDGVSKSVVIFQYYPVASLYQSTIPITIGMPLSNGGPNAFSLGGQIGRVQIYTRAFTTNEVYQLFLKGPP